MRPAQRCCVAPRMLLCTQQAARWGVPAPAALTQRSCWCRTARRPAERPGCTTASQCRVGSKEGEGRTVVRIHGNGCFLIRMLLHGPPCGSTDAADQRHQISRSDSGCSKPTSGHHPCHPTHRPCVAVVAAAVPARAIQRGKLHTCNCKTSGMEQSAVQASQQTGWRSGMYQSCRLVVNTLAPGQPLERVQTHRSARRGWAAPPP